MAGADWIPIAEAARMLGYKSKKTILRLGEQGLLDVRKVRGRWVVSRAEVRAARVLTTGRAAKLAGCSKKTVYRRIAAGVVTPVRPAEPACWMSERAVARFSLQDVADIRASLRRRRAPRPRASRGRQPRNGVTPTQPRLTRDRQGRLWLHAHGRWWPLAGTAHPTATR